ncbi:UNVERIFIED_CONTAM: hypothetical protein Sindi_2638500 [Sesamum indicum]
MDRSPRHAGQRLCSSHCLRAYGFMFYFTPRWGFFSPFPHGTTSLSVTQEYLALQGCNFQAASPSSTTLVLLSHNPVFTGLGCSHFARRYYGNRFLLSFPLATKMFSSPGCLLPAHGFSSSSKGCPIRESPDLMLIFNSPKHFVDYYALPRLWVPRYPP